MFSVSYYLWYMQSRAILIKKHTSKFFLFTGVNISARNFLWRNSGVIGVNYIPPCNWGWNITIEEISRSDASSVWDWNLIISRMGQYKNSMPSTAIYESGSCSRHSRLEMFKKKVVRRQRSRIIVLVRLYVLSCFSYTIQIGVQEHRLVSFSVYVVTILITLILYD